MGPKEVRSTVLTPEEEAIIVAFRRHALLPLDDCLYALQPTLPHLTHSSLHRCLQRPVSCADIRCKSAVVTVFGQCRDCVGAPVHPLGLVPVPEIGPRRTKAAS